MTGVMHDFFEAKWTKRGRFFLFSFSAITSVWFIPFTITFWVREFKIVGFSIIIAKNNDAFEKSFFVF